MMPQTLDDRLRLAAAGTALLLILPLGCVQPAQEDEASTPSGVEQEQVEERWLLAPSRDGDPVRASDTREDLRRRLGEGILRDDSIAVGEGMFEPGTVLYPDQPERRAAVEWDDDGTASLVRISEDAGSAWRLHPGVGIGTTLAELEQLNGGPFELYGFEWDYGGTTAGWRGGRLGELWGDHVLLRLHPTVSDPELGRRVSGERIFRSDDAAMQGLRPAVYQILVRPR